jgi:hypothetical protein
MIPAQTLGLVAIAALLLAGFLGRNALRKDRGLRLAIGILLFCSVAALATSVFRQPWIAWPLGLSMLAAMTFLVRTMHLQIKAK